MFFLPIGYSIFFLFILSLPLLFILGYFHVISIGFGNLGISQGATMLLLLAILIGSLINIPLGRKKLVYLKESRFFGLWQAPRVKAQGLAVNLGGAVIPVFLSFYFLFLTWKSGLELKPILTATFLMIFVCKLLARTVPGRGIFIPFFIPPAFASVFALIFAPGFAAPCSFICGTMGVLIGGDLLNLRKIQKQGGFLSIGGAGVFDGIFLVGVISALLTGF